MALTDHRGRQVPVRLPWTSWIFPRRVDERGLTPEQIQRVRHNARWRHAPFWWSHVVLLFLAGLFALILAVRAWELTTALNRGPAWYQIVGSLSSLAVISIFLPRTLRARAAAVREHPVLIESNLEHGRCPACAYSLAGLPVESDGCRICPECAAAWRLPA